MITTEECKEEFRKLFDQLLSAEGLNTFQMFSRADALIGLMRDLLDRARRADLEEGEMARRGPKTPLRREKRTEGILLLFVKRTLKIIELRFFIIIILLMCNFYLEF